jgi:TrpR-related protein YerC/YecD
MKTKCEITSLFEAFLLLKTANEIEKFFIDLCTPQEIKTMKERWEVCQLLASGDFSYREIQKITGTSTTTITRVARFLNDEPYKGYLTLLNKIKDQPKCSEN